MFWTTKSKSYARKMMSSMWEWMLTFVLDPHLNRALASLDWAWVFWFG